MLALDFTTLYLTYAHILAHGCALRIKHSPQSVKVYSVPTTYSSFRESRNACADIAMNEGVLDFIRHGNGRSGGPAFASMDPLDHWQETEALAVAEESWTVRTYFDRLPKPFPETFQGETVITDKSNAVS